MRRLGLGIVLGAALLAAGCGGPPELVPVTGTVKIDGKTYRAVRIHFEPLVPSQKTTVYQLGLGITDDQGKFSLKSSGGDGIEAGEYKVTFSRVVSGGKVQAEEGKKPEGNGARETLPDHLTKMDKTKEIAKVSKDSHDFVFDLSSK